MNRQYSEKEFWYYEQTQRTEMLDFVNNKSIKKILDVGCSTGGFGKQLKSIHQCETWGIEPFFEAFQAAQKVLDVTVNAGIEDALKIIKKEKFDHIFFIDVLEHLENPWEILKAIKNNLSENGRIVASIPNIRYYPVMLGLLRYSDFMYVQSGVLDKTHLRFFTQKSMIKMFEESGFNVIQINPINRANYPMLNIINFILLGKLWDMSYPQFALVAEIRK
jgi:2-polyprenyl-3-methyl-5-hydroxy-6-metoxy-1,4-benzoquinol methylase